MNYENNKFSPFGNAAVCLSGMYYSTAKRDYPNDWFHAAIKVQYPAVKVFVNDSKEASLEVSQLSSQKGGWIGFWVGNNSEGYFNHLKITMDDK